MRNKSLLGVLILTAACTFDVSTWPKWRFDAGLEDAGHQDAGRDSGLDASTAGHSGAGGEPVAGMSGGAGSVGGGPSIGGQGGETQAGSGADPDPDAGQPAGGTGGVDAQAGSGGEQGGQGGALEPEGGQGGSVSPPDLLSPTVITFSIVNEQGFSTVASGETLLGSVTYQNPNDQPFTVEQIVIAGRPPGGTHAGGPYLDLMPIRNRPLTIPPRESITYTASRTMRVTDPLGRWEFYPTWQSADNEWHDGAGVFMEVVRLPREDDQDGGI